MPLSVSLPIQPDVPLAPLTTLELGGPAQFLLEARSEDDVEAGLAWAEARGLPAHLLGAGSNLIVPDAGVPGLVIRLATRGLTFQPGADAVMCEVAAGERWDDVVAAAVERDLAGIECLSGIPGTAGATPVQNVGAYGQEVSETIARVRVYDRQARSITTLAPAACGFAYRDSTFKRDPGRFVLLGVTFALVPGGAPALRYPELHNEVRNQLRAAYPEATPMPTLAEVRRVVIGLRRRKSMVIDAADPNRRSVGSFFTNPVVSPAAADAIAARAEAAGLIASPADLPRFPAANGQQKLAAAWLIERAGVRKGERRGGIAVSSAHALALVHLGGARTADLLAFAREIRDRVATRFGVTLAPEPVVLGAAPGADPLA